MFEALILGFFAEQNILTDIEVPVGAQGSTIDAEIKLTPQPIYVEVT